MTTKSPMKNSDFAELERHFDHTSEAHAANVLDCYRVMQTHCPVAHSDRHGGFWVSSRYETIVKMLRQNDLFASGDGVVIPPLPFPVRALPTESDKPSSSPWSLTRCRAGPRRPLTTGRSPLPPERRLPTASAPRVPQHRRRSCVRTAVPQRRAPVRSRAVHPAGSATRMYTQGEETQIESCARPCDPDITRQGKVQAPQTAGSLTVATVGSVQSATARKPS